MIISIQDELIEVKNYLLKLGYEVYNLSDRINSDVYVYSESKMGLMNLYNSAGTKDGGSLIIDVDGKSRNDILYSINHRIYSPLF